MRPQNGTCFSRAVGIKPELEELNYIAVFPLMPWRYDMLFSVNSSIVVYVAHRNL